MRPNHKACIARLRTLRRTAATATASLGGSMVMLTLSRALAALLMLATMAVLTRHLGAAGFGAYRTIVAYLSFATIVASLGLHLTVGREIALAGTDQSRLMGQALALRLTSVGVLLLIAAGIARLLPYSPEVQIGILLGSVGFVMFAGNQLLLALFQQCLRQAGAVMAEVGGATVLLVLAVLLALLGADVLAFVGALVVGYLVMLAISWRFAHRLLPFRLGFEPQAWHRLAWASLPLAGTNVLFVFYYHSDTIILSILSPASQVGLYGIASKVQDTLLGFATIFAGLMLPLLARSAHQPERFRQHLGQGLDTLAVGAVGCAALLIAFAEPVVVLIAGPTFAPAATALRVLSFTVGIGAISLLLRYSVTALDRQKELVPGYVLAVVLSLVVQVLMIPPLGAVGAALGPLSGEIVVLLAAWRILARGTGLAPSMRGTGKAGLAGVCLVLVAWYSPLAELHWLLALPLLGLFYLIVLALTQGIPHAALEMLAARPPSPRGVPASQTL